MVYDKTLSLDLYRHGEYIVEIWETNDLFEATLCNERYGIKSYLFGFPKSQPTVPVVTKEMFLDMVENTLQEHIDFYREEYED